MQRISSRRNVCQSDHPPPEREPSPSQPDAFPVRRVISQSIPFIGEWTLLAEVAEVIHKIRTRPIMEKSSTQTLNLSKGELLA